MDETRQTVAEAPRRAGVLAALRRVTVTGEIISILIALAILCLFFSLTSPYFLSIKNIMNFTMNASILGIMAAGLFIAMVIGEIDVSQYAILALSTAVMVILIRRGMQAGPAIAIALAVALTCGVINGVSVAFLRINPARAAVRALKTRPQKRTIFTLMPEM